MRHIDPRRSSGTTIRYAYGNKGNVISQRPWNRYVAMGVCRFYYSAADPLQWLPWRGPRNMRPATRSTGLEEAWRSAVLQGNISAMDALLADDYMAITPTGILQSKEQALANLRAGTSISKR